VRGLPEELRKQARAWAKASCADQGLAVLVTDPAVLSRVAGLLGAPSGRQAVGDSSRPADESGSPDRLEPAGLEAVDSGPTGPDEYVVEQGRDDRVLPG